MMMMMMMMKMHTFLWRFALNLDSDNCATARESAGLIVQDHRNAAHCQQRSAPALSELTFIDYGEVPKSQQSKLQFLLFYDGTTSLTTAYVVPNKADQLTISHLQEYFEDISLIQNELLPIKPL